jgi:pimeloyl-ACP methyl ester carboxylesterase
MRVANPCYVIAILFAGSPLLSPAAHGADDPLKRTAFLGTSLQSVSAEVREAAKIADDEGGALIDQVFPNSSAEAAGLKKGDILLNVAGVKADGPAPVVKTLAGRKAGESLELTYVRDAKRVKASITLKGRPLESSLDYDIVYDSVVSQDHRLRTIVTKPRTGGKHPALFFIQGIGLYSVDNPAGSLSSYRTIIDDFTRRGWITLRVEKPGVGDSEGGPGELVDFDTELDGYRQGLKRLKAMDSVDSDKVVLFGHSMGGVMAPLLAMDTPVKGIAAYGTISKTWYEYVLENFRRQWTLAEADPDAIDRQMRVEAAFAHYLCRDKLAPREIAEKYPDLREHVANVSSNGISVFDRHYTFFGQLASKDLGGAWAKLGGHALAMWGKADFISGESDHALIASIVNLDHPGHGTFAAIDGADHGFHRASSFQDARKRSSPPEFNPAVLETLRTWAERIVNDGGK